MAAAPDPTALRVLTLNVLAPAYADWPARRRVVLSELRRLRPDVVALQEVAHRADHDEATELLGPEFYLARHPAVADDGTTAVLACRWPFGMVHQIDLDLDARAREFALGGAVVAEVLGPPSIGPLVVVHHKPVFQLGYERQRELQAAAHGPRRRGDGQWPCCAGPRRPARRLRRHPGCGEHPLLDRTPVA